ncbi:single-stranded-DNA-specific exonuclease RecJ [Methylophilaceae bacterium]|nr:single-stranded-DNA-specific exonuclease RecJ [Methylophilaceae bacterium]
MRLQEKIIDPKIYDSLVSKGINPALSSLFASRDISSVDDIDYKLDKLLSPDLLKSIKEASNLLIDKIDAKQKIVIIGDYDADGATATACGYLGLKKFGADVDFIVPNRFKFGYGLTPEIVDLANKKEPSLIVTVDNGIASIAGVRRAKSYGIDVIITDHHLPAEELPDANFIVNPNQNSCNFPSKNLCGVGVIFYVLLSLRIELRKINRFDIQPEPVLSDLLDLVALGTVADLVKLDFNNRVLVNYGIKRIRSGNCNLGIEALARLSNKKLTDIKTSDLSFSIAPKINAAGRLDDISVGIKCLISRDNNEAEKYAKQLGALNEQRKLVENEMKDAALTILSECIVKDNYTIAMYDEKWHQGVVGILASRLKEKYYRPTIIFAQDANGNLKGSGRSIASFHLRDALDLVSKKNPNLILSFGGHAMAAGLSIKINNFKVFCSEFEIIAKELLSPDKLNLIIEFDKSIPKKYLNHETIRAINSQVWGQGFPIPVFFGVFDVVRQEIVAAKHNKCILKKKDCSYDAIFFNFSGELADRIEVIYTIELNEFNQKSTIQFIIKSQNEKK